MRAAAALLWASLLACGERLPPAALPPLRPPPPCVVEDPPRLAVVPAAVCSRLGRAPVRGAVCEELRDGEPPTTTTKFWALPCEAITQPTKEAVP